MKKSLPRAFVFSLIAFIVINFMTFIVGYWGIGSLYLTFDAIAAHPAWIIRYLVESIRHLPWELVIGFSFSINTAWAMIFMGQILSLTFASIIAGISGGSIRRSVGGWILTCISVIVSFIAMYLIDSFTLLFYPLNEGIILVVLPGIVNLVIFSGVAAVVALLIGRYKR